MKTTNILTYYNLHPIIKVLGDCLEIPNDVKFKAINDIVEMHLDKKYGNRTLITASAFSLTKPIIRSFDWTESKLGFSFWLVIHMAIDEK